MDDADPVPNTSELFNYNPLVEETKITASGGTTQN